MNDLFSVKKVASIVSLPKKSVMKVLRAKHLITESRAITQNGLESGFVTELRVPRYANGVEYTETHLRVTSIGVLLLLEELVHDDSQEKAEVCHG